MAIIAVAGESSEVDPSIVAPNYGASGSLHDLTATRTYLSTDEGSVDNRVYLNWAGSISEGWLHFTVNTPTDTDDNWSLIRGQSYTNGAYSSEWRIASEPATGTYIFQTWSGSAWVDVGATFTLPLGLTQTIDVYFNLDNVNGVFLVYRDANLVHTYNGPISTPTGTINAFRLSAADSVSTFYYSEIIVADESTIGYRLITLEPTADSSVVDWVGSYTNIDAVNYADEASPMTSDVIGAKALFTGANVDASFSTLEVKAVVVSGVYSVTGGGTVTDLRPILNTGGLDFNGPLLNLPNTGELRRHQEIWHNNPNTTTKWTIPEVDALTYGALTA